MIHILLEHSLLRKTLRIFVHFGIMNEVMQHWEVYPEQIIDMPTSQFITTSAVPTFKQTEIFQ